MKKELQPQLLEGIKRLRVTTNRLVNTGLIGTYKSLFKGRGLEFEGFRPYTPDDDASVIDWKASVKSKQILIREFVEERNLSVFLLIDVSSSMVYGTGSKLKVEYAAEIASTLSFVILNAGDSVGFALFNDKVIFSVLPVAGYKQQNILLKSIVNPSNYGGNYDLNEALKYTISKLKQASVVIIISDFIGLKAGWENYVRMLSKRFDVIGIMVRDPCDRNLPDYSGNVVLSDPFSDENITVNTSDISESYRRHVMRQEDDIKRTFLIANADFASVSTDEQFLKPLSNLFMKRSKRLK